jgi:hypothetical protein
MRTKYGEITIAKIIVASLLVTFWTLTCSGVAAGVDGPSLDLNIKYYFIGFLSYLFLLISGFIVNMYDEIRNPNKDYDKEILKLKKKGNFIYRSWHNINPIEDEIRHLNRNEVTAFDRFFITHGPPFDDAWEFEYGVVYWFGMLPFMGAVIIGMGVVLPLCLIVIAYNFFF